MSISNDLDKELCEFKDLIIETLNPKFIKTWRFKYSEKFLKLFQFKIISSLERQKPLKADKLYKYFTKDCGYNPEQVIDFFNSVNLELYYPVVMFDRGKNLPSF